MLEKRFKTTTELNTQVLPRVHATCASLSTLVNACSQATINLAISTLQSTLAMDFKPSDIEVTLVSGFDAPVSPNRPLTNTR